MYDDQLIDLYCSTNTDITLNVENKGTLTIEKTGQWAVIDIYDGDDKPDISGSTSHVTIHGNLDLFMDCENKSSRNDARAINLLNNNDHLEIDGNTRIKIDNINENMSYGKYWADGIRAFSGTIKANGDFFVDGVNAKSDRDNHVYGASTGVYSTTSGERMNSSTDDTFSSYIVLGVDSNNEVEIQHITATAKDGFTSAIGIVSEGNQSVVDVNGNAKIHDIRAVSDAGHAESMALVANDKGIININGDLDIKDIEGTGVTNEVVALQVYNGGIINVNAANDVNRVINIMGDIDGGDINDGDKITLNLLNDTSSLTGASTGNVDMNLSNGATWHVTNRHLINDPAVDGDIKANHIHSLSGTAGIIQIDLDAEKNTGGNTVSIDEHSGEHYIRLKNVNPSDLHAGATGTVLLNVGEENGLFKAQSSENGLYWETYQLDKKDDGNGTEWYLKEAKQQETDNDKPNGKPTTSVSTLLSTVTAGYDTWRNDADKLNERMGELRLQGKGNEGLWVRTKGSEFGRHGSHGAYTNRQHTYQLGYDVVTHQDEAQTTYTGVAAEYGKGSASFEHGNGRMRNYGFGLYQTRIRESGHYLDLIYKFDKYKNDFHVTDTAGNPISGKYGNNAMSLSAEYGRKNTLGHDWYVEPQGEVTLGYMWGNDFVTSNHIHVEQKNMPALIGRLGVNVGRQVGDRFNFYVKASINHDFLGDYDVRMTDLSTGDRLAAKDSFGSSWFDYGTGFSVKATKDSYIFFDMERAVGGNYKKNWDWNAGVRWSF